MLLVFVLFVYQFAQVCVCALIRRLSREETTGTTHVSRTCTRSHQLLLLFQCAGGRESPHDQLDEQRAANNELLSRENVSLSLPELFVGEPPFVMRPAVRTFRPSEISDRRVDKDVV